MFDPDFLPPVIKKFKYYWKYRNKKYKTKEQALLKWYRDQVKSGNIN